jgi:pimeloyl-ACP methyl ester carboxylesterase
MLRGGEMPKAEVNGINIAYYVSGSGEPLVMIVAIEDSQQTWIFQKRAFSKHFKVVTFDSRGAGKSDKPDEPYTIKTLADDTIGLMNHLGIDKAHILGVSGGGRVAQEIAINYPERVKKLVLASTDHGGGDEMTPEMQRVFGVTGHFSEDSKLIVGRSQCPVCHEYFPKKELWEHQWSAHHAWMLEWAKSMDFYKLVTQSFNKTIYKLFILPLAWLHLRLGGKERYIKHFEIAVGHSTLDRLHLVKAPTLVIIGTEDKLLPLHSSEEIAERIPNAKLVKFEGGSHTLIYEMRGRFNKEVLDFLRA